MSEFPLYPNNCHHDEMPERCWRCLESELAEARARLTEAQAQNESRGLALLGEQRQLADARARIAELEQDNRDWQAQAKGMAKVADRHRDHERVLDARCRELESRNAAEKAMAREQVERHAALFAERVFAKRRRGSFWIKLTEAELAAHVAEAVRHILALTPAPDAKGAVK